ncbi:ABC transporter ATP-binding protein [Rhizobium panacihumi]|uniref:ABC transporter ATP-binding protein n=1 Tax=Rhizobium panacihumi TaxID=2008450 RepID=UPI003D7B4627
MADHGNLEIRNIDKTYLVDQKPFRVLSNVSLDAPAGSFVTIVGPSGCGKSTLLRLIIGLDDGYDGEILLDGKKVSGTSLSRGIVFQDHRLLPWLTLEQNIALSLENSTWSTEDKRKAINDHIALVGLQGFENSYPHQLSGGMAQRAAIARGLVNHPQVLLLDEPLGALDALTRQRLQGELERIWKAEGVTMILVTHDVDEAIYLSDRVVVMAANPGRVVRDFVVDIPKPRDRAGHEFADLKRQILAAMGETAHYAEAAE